MDKVDPRLSFVKLEPLATEYSPGPQPLYMQDLIFSGNVPVPAEIGCPSLESRWLGITSLFLGLHRGARRHLGHSGRLVEFQKTVRSDRKQCQIARVNSQTAFSINAAD